ncbi:DUF2207 domain-containing protein [Jatrophihabitans fulvus]
MDLALASPTWGLTGPAFLGLYSITTIVVIGGSALLLNRGRTSRPRAKRRYDDIGPVQLGLLGGGPSLAVTVALADLRRLELVAVDGTRREPVGLSKPTSLLDPVTLAVWRALPTSPGGRVRPRTLAAQPSVVAALAACRAELADDGLVTRPPSRRRVVAACLLGAALVAFGGVRIAAGSEHHRPVGFLVGFVLLAAAAQIAVVVGLSRPTWTARGRIAVQTLRSQHDHLSPRLRPAWDAYGGPSVVLATALFGGIVVMTADPAFADAVDAREVEHAAAAQSSAWSGGGNSSGGGSSCGSGSNCGGGSCGGGGGCGGGGCGG